jgi:hypothetical protein
LQCPTGAAGRRNRGLRARLYKIHTGGHSFGEDHWRTVYSRVPGSLWGEGTGINTETKETTRLDFGVDLRFMGDIPGNVQPTASPRRFRPHMTRPVRLRPNSPAFASSLTLIRLQGMFSLRSGGSVTECSSRQKTQQKRIRINPFSRAGALTDISNYWSCLLGLCVKINRRELNLRLETNSRKEQS